jgi:hypothetical protein
MFIHCAGSLCTVAIRIQPIKQIDFTVRSVVLFPKEGYLIGGKVVTLNLLCVFFNRVWGYFIKRAFRIALIAFNINALFKGHGLNSNWDFFNDFYQFITGNVTIFKSLVAPIYNARFNIQNAGGFSVLTVCM